MYFNIIHIIRRAKGHRRLRPYSILVTLIPFRGPRAYNYFPLGARVTFRSVPRAIKMLSRASLSHLPAIFASAMSFPSIYHRFSIDFRLILESFWAPKSCCESDSDYVSLCNHFPLIFYASAFIMN